MAMRNFSATRWSSFEGWVVDRDLVKERPELALVDLPVDAGIHDWYPRSYEAYETSMYKSLNGDPKA
jgi:hypothetical protein